MADVTDTVGTAARDYSTWASWESSLSAHAGDNVTGEGYNDSTFSETPIINDTTPDLIILSAASGERHDGTPGTGVQITGGLDLRPNKPITVEWIEIDEGGSTVGIIINTAAGQIVLQRLLVYNFGTFGIDQNGATARRIQNVMIFRGENTGTGNNDLVGIDDLTPSSVHEYQNITIHNVTRDNGTASAECYGIRFSDDADLTLRNCLVTEVDGTTAGTIGCYDPSTVSSATVSHNAASDTTATGTGSLDSVTTADQYVSTTAGSEDLHLKSGADAIDAGTDLGTTPAGVNIDIDGRDRDAEGDTWDMGADEFVAAAGGLPIGGLAMMGCGK